LLTDPFQEFGGRGVARPRNAHLTPPTPHGLTARCQAACCTPKGSRNLCKSTGALRIQPEGQMNCLVIGGADDEWHLHIALRLLLFSRRCPASAAEPLAWSAIITPMLRETSAVSVRPIESQTPTD